MRRFAEGQLGLCAGLEEDVHRIISDEVLGVAGGADALKPIQPQAVKKPIQRN